MLHSNNAALQQLYQKCDLRTQRRQQQNICPDNRDNRTEYTMENTFLTQWESFAKSAFETTKELEALNMKKMGDVKKC